MEKRCKHEEKNCPACGTIFECKAGDIANCQCNGIIMSNETVAYISKTYDDCLCRDCLMKLHHSALQGSSDQFKGY